MMKKNIMRTLMLASFGFLMSESLIFGGGLTFYPAGTTIINDENTAYFTNTSNVAIGVQPGSGGKSYAGTYYYFVAPNDTVAFTDANGNYDNLNQAYIVFCASDNSNVSWANGAEPQKTGSEFSPNSSTIITKYYGDSGTASAPKDLSFESNGSGTYYSISCTDSSPTDQSSFTVTCNGTTVPTPNPLPVPSTTTTTSTPTTTSTSTPTTTSTTTSTPTTTTSSSSSAPQPSEKQAAIIAFKHHGSNGPNM